jgi:quinol monooxygenase YgiN
MKATFLIVLLAGILGAATQSSSATGTLHITAATMPHRVSALSGNADNVQWSDRASLYLVADDGESAMSNVFWTFKVNVKDGEVGKLKDLIAEMSNASEANEPGTLIYEWAISGDQKSAEVHERYADSDAALKHLASFNDNFADRLMALVQPAGMIVYGSPSAALKKKLEGADPVYMDVIGGFAR